MRRAGGALLAFVLAAIGCSCEGAAPPAKQPQPHAEALSRLRAFEQSERARVDFAKLPSSDRVSGADPYAVERLGERYVGLLRGSSQLVLLDDGGRELHRVAAPRSPTGLAVKDGRIVVVGELDSKLATYTVDEAAGELVAGPTIDLSQGLEPCALRAVAAASLAHDQHVVYVVDEWRDELIVVPFGDESVSNAGEPALRQSVCAGPFDIEADGRHVFINCLIDHTLLIRTVDEHGVPEPAGDQRIVHDGPIWSFDVMWMEGKERHTPGPSVIALGGVENAPLDRGGGFFGHVDSYAYIYTLDDEPTLRATVNLSAERVVTPKAIRIAPQQGRHARFPLELWISGYGGDRALRYQIAEGDDGKLRSKLNHSAALPAGTTAAAFTGDGVLIANPLIDAWVSLKADAVKVVSVPADHAPDDEQRLGEALFFTTLMAPANPTADAHSSFTCETCHFEGYVDGRTHHTGRGDVHATTKPLRGLFNNKPHFTRALDPDLTQVVHAEFRVAGAESGHAPWFELTRKDHPWLAYVSKQERVGAEQLRRSLMRFLMSFTHRPNPHVIGRKKFSAEQREGAAVFKQRCAGCHAARLSTDDAGSEVPFERWESLVLSERGPIVWAKDGYVKSGVEPYVHPKGARTSSLRRLYKKRPYFTNGSAKTLEAVLSSVRYQGDGFFHAAGPAGAEALSEQEQAALLSFLRLL